MKKYLFLMIALVGLAGMSGCDKNDDSYYNPNRTFVYTVGSNEWGIESNGFRFSHEIVLPELDQYIVDQGNVSVAVSFDNGASYDILRTIGVKTKKWAVSV